MVTLLLLIITYITQWYNIWVKVVKTIDDTIHL